MEKCDGTRRDTSLLRFAKLPPWHVQRSLRAVESGVRIQVPEGTYGISNINTIAKPWLGVFDKVVLPILERDEDASARKLKSLTGRKWVC
jgi:hypothetical protein